MSSERSTVVETEPSQTLMRSGGSSPTFSTSMAWTRAVDSSRAYASDTKDLSVYDVRSFCAT